MGTFMTILVLVVATVLALFWLFLHMRYKNQFEDIMSGINPDEYQVPELFYIGFGFLDVINMDL